MENLKDQIQKALDLPEDHFSTYHSDLYVKHSEKVWAWLKGNYEHPRSLTTFISQVDQKLWIEIPFGYANEDFLKKYPSGLAIK